MLAACMHAGFTSLRVPATFADVKGSLGASGASAMEIDTRYTEHGTGDALGYGADWAPWQTRWGYRNKQCKRPLLAATCSFYDCALHLWSCPVPHV